jgi:hypothetical protein
MVGILVVLPDNPRVGKGTELQLHPLKAKGGVLHHSIMSARHSVQYNTHHGKKFPPLLSVKLRS